MTNFPSTYNILHINALFINWISWIDKGQDWSCILMSDDQVRERAIYVALEFTTVLLSLIHIVPLQRISRMKKKVVIIYIYYIYYIIYISYILNPREWIY